ncbi:MAG: glycyl-radical enzyme activating protein [Clostridia bacterium]|nr:glycyl-radical enzyme activating protein [Clostridia bacterium]
MNETGVIFDIQRFSIHDGPGIRTNIFLKGCPLECMWCHNPEGLSPKPEISFLEKKCAMCGRCAAVCPKGCHRADENGHTFDRGACIACGKCAEACFFGALELVGRRMNASEVLDEAMKDETFFKTSGGGVTLSGGEPMFQPSFSKAILAEAKRRGLSTCMETSGYASQESFRALIDYVDLFLFDIKETSRERHIEFTGVDNTPILANLRLLSECGKQIVLRCPLIPGKNDRTEHAETIAALAETHSGVIRIEIEPYHPLGVSKRLRFGKASKYDRDKFMDKADAEAFARIVRANTAAPVEVK